MELRSAERILRNITKTVSCAVFDLDNSVFGYGRYGLNDGNRGRGIKAFRGEGTDGMGGGAERPRGSSQQCSAMHAVSPTGETKAETLAETATAKKARKEWMVKEQLERKGLRKRYVQDSLFSTIFRLGTSFTSASHEGLCDSIARSAEDVVRVVHEDYVTLAVHLYLLFTRMKAERFMGTKPLQQRQHVVFKDRSDCRTHLSPDIQLPTRYSCGAHPAAEIHLHEGSRVGDTNGRAVLVWRKPYRVWRYKSFLED